MEVKEREFTQMILQGLRLLNWAAYHTYDSRRSEPGFPDIVAAHPQYGVIFAELKTEKGYLSQHQKHWVAVLEDAGARVYIWRPRDWTTIEMVMKGYQGGTTRDVQAGKLEGRRAVRKR